MTKVRLKSLQRLKNEYNLKETCFTYEDEVNKFAIDKFYMYAILGEEVELSPVKDRDGRITVRVCRWPTIVWTFPECYIDNDNEFDEVLNLFNKPLYVNR